MLLGNFYKSGVVEFDDSASQAINEDEENGPELEAVVNTPRPQERVDYVTYKPPIVGNEWILSETHLCDFPRLFILEARKWEGCGILGIVGHHLLPASMFPNRVFRVAEAPAHLIVAKSYALLEANWRSIVSEFCAILWYVTFFLRCRIL